MKTVTLSVRQARDLDRRSQDEFGIPPLLLMESAGQILANVVQASLIPPTQMCRVVFLCGTGNNGGDGFVAARHLFQRGVPSEVFLVGEERSLAADAAVNYRIIRQLGLPVAPVADFDAARREWERKPVVLVDAILGTGLKLPLRDPAAAAIRLVNEFRKSHNSTVRVIAVDIPSGLDGDEGPVQPDVVRANTTVTFACYKPGLLKPASHPFVGRLEIGDIGVPEKLLLRTAEG